MINNIFHIIGIFILILNISVLIYLNEFLNISEWCFKYKKITGISPKEEDFRSVRSYNVFIIVTLFAIIEILWIVFGYFIYTGIFITISVIGWIVKKTMSNKIHKLLVHLFFISRTSIYIWLIFEYFSK